MNFPVPLALTFRTVGWPELLVMLAFLALLLGPRRLGGLGRRFGEFFRVKLHVIQWLYWSATGNEADQLRAEERVGQDISNAFTGQTPLEPDESKQELIRALGGKLSEAVAGTQRRFHFRVLADRDFQAFAVPGGFIFVNRPVLDHLQESPGELAFVLAHEMSHVIERHTLERHLRDAILDAVLKPWLAGRLVSAVLARGYSREQELDADAEAVNLMMRAGFAPESAVGALEQMARLRDVDPTLGRYLGSHPPLADRIAAAQALCASMRRRATPQRGPAPPR